jgi:hypothetical protein
MEYTDEKICEAIHTLTGLLAVWSGENDTQTAWARAGTAEQHRLRVMVRQYRNGAAPREVHERLRAEREAEGWAWGPVYDQVAKTDPLLVRYEDLPDCQRDKLEVGYGLTTVLVLRSRR